MYRLSFLVVALPALVAAAPALAADFPGYSDDTLRPSYDDWQQTPEAQPLGFEFGLRYWYSWGDDDWNSGASDYSSDDKTQFLEGHLRIDDYTTNSYVKGLAGYSVAIRGSYSDPSTIGSEASTTGGIGYAGADFGWSPFGTPDGQSGIYGLVGYQYWREAPDPNAIDIHALRLGVSARAVVDNTFDVNAELAAVPYAWVNGTLANDSVASLDVDTSAYGAMGELMLGFHPTENFVGRVGARAWYLKGETNGNGSGSNPFSLFRYGLLGELTYKF